MSEILAPWILKLKTVKHSKSSYIKFPSPNNKTGSILENAGSWLPKRQPNLQKAVKTQRGRRKSPTRKEKHEAPPEQNRRMANAR